jgi:hypothetical protein
MTLSLGEPQLHPVQALEPPCIEGHRLVHPDSLDLVHRHRRNTRGPQLSG